MDWLLLVFLWNKSDKCYRNLYIMIIIIKKFNVIYIICTILMCSDVFLLELNLSCVFVCFSHFCWINDNKIENLKEKNIAFNCHFIEIVFMVTKGKRCVDLLNFVVVEMIRKVKEKRAFNMNLSQIANTNDVNGQIRYQNNWISWKSCMRIAEQSRGNYHWCRT